MQVPMEHLMILAHPNADKLRKKGIIEGEEFEEFFEAFHSAMEVWLEVLREEIGATGRCFRSPTLIAKFYDNIAQRLRMTCMHLGVW